MPNPIFTSNTKKGDSFTFQTMSSSATTFDGSVYMKSNFTTGGGRATFDYGDGTGLDADNTPSHVYNDSGTTKTVTIRVGKIEDMYQMVFTDEQIVGNLDLSPLHFAGTNQGVNFSSNSLLTGVTYNPTSLNRVRDPSNATGIYDIDFSSCDITGELDLSNFKIRELLNGGTLQLYFDTNPNMTQIVLPPFNVDSSHSGDLGYFNGDFRVYNCDITGNLDVSPMSGNGISNIESYGNSNMTGITLNNLGKLGCLRSYSCDLQGVLDMSMLVLGGDNCSAANTHGLQVSSNSGLTGILLTGSNETIKVINVSACDITGNLDISMLSGFTTGGQGILTPNNPNLNIITLPSTGSVGVIDVSSCGLTGTTDLSTGIDCGGFDCDSNTNLENILFKSSDYPITQLVLPNCGLQDMDFTPLSGISGTFQVYTNSSLSALTFTPNNNGTFTRFDSYNCNLTGTLDLPFSGLSGIFQVYGNSGLTNVTHATTSNSFTYYYADTCDLGYVDLTPLSGGTSDDINMRLYDNTMTATEVNHILVDLDVFGWTGGTLDISGSNATPDGTSGGFDGLTARDNLTGKTWTVTTS
tara:strand:- start:387 stop:2129 length:1743 start_codon:yes stop_codon:yes gene_type:complete